MNINPSMEDWQNLDVPFSLSEHISPHLSPLQGFGLQMDSFQEDYLQHKQQKPAQSNESCQQDEVKQFSYCSHFSGPCEEKGSEQQQKQEENPQIKQSKNLIILTAQFESKVKSLVHFLIENDELSESDMRSYGAALYKDSDDLKFVFEELLSKFKKLKKTKEEMTKYCMRKAFKFFSDQRYSLKKKGNGKLQNQTEKKTVFETPFKKNSSEKTMNAQFLREVFSHKQFVSEYERFLTQISKMIEEDNMAKISFLSQTIEECLKSRNFKKIQSIKRLPWTKSILNKTKLLAIQLREYGNSCLTQQINKSMANRFE